MNVTYPKKFPNSINPDLDPPKFIEATNIKNSNFENNNANNLVIATENSKIFIKNQNFQGSSAYEASNSGSFEPEYNSLQINHKITCLRILENSYILIGTSSYILCINPVDNSTIFYKQVSDEVTSLAAAKLENLDDGLGSSEFSGETICYVGGASGSITGYDVEGTDTFWSVLDNEITSILELDNKMLLVGTSNGKLQNISLTDNSIISECYKNSKILRWSLGIYGKKSRRPLEKATPKKRPQKSVPK